MKIFKTKFINKNSGKAIKNAIKEILFINFFLFIQFYKAVAITIAD